MTTNDHFNKIKCHLTAVGISSSRWWSKSQSYFTIKSSCFWKSSIVEENRSCKLNNGGETDRWPSSIISTSLWLKSLIWLPMTEVCPVSNKFESPPLTSLKRSDNCELTKSFEIWSNSLADIILDWPSLRKPDNRSDRRIKVSVNSETKLDSSQIVVIPMKSSSSTIEKSDSFPLMPLSDFASSLKSFVDSTATYKDPLILLSETASIFSDLTLAECSISFKFGSCKLNPAPRTSRIHVSYPWPDMYRAKEHCQYENSTWKKGSYVNPTRLKKSLLSSLKTLAQTIWWIKKNMTLQLFIAWEYDQYAQRMKIDNRGEERTWH